MEGDIATMAGDHLGHALDTVHTVARVDALGRVAINGPVDGNDPRVFGLVGLSSMGATQRI